MDFKMSEMDLRQFGQRLFSIFCQIFAYIFEYLIDSFIFLAHTWKAQLDFEKYHPKNEEKPLQHLPNL